MTFEARFVREHVDVMARVNWNKVHLRPGWTVSTVRTTLDIVVFLWSRGLLFATEVKMKNGLRADILCPSLDGSQVIEVYDSEGFASLDRKKAVYESSGVSFLAVPADSVDALRLIAAANNL